MAEPNTSCDNPFESYSILVDINTIKDFPAKGWQIYGSEQDRQVTGTPVAVFGEQKSGKTWLTSNLVGRPLVVDQIINTSGLGALYCDSPNKRSIFIDFAGHDAPCHEKTLLDLRCTESLIRDILLAVSDHFVYVTSKFLRSIQLDLKSLVRDSRGRSRNGILTEINQGTNKLIVVHNMMEAISEEILNARIAETASVYVEWIVDQETGGQEQVLDSWVVNDSFYVHAAECKGQFIYYQTKYCNHVFLMHDPPGDINNLDSDQLKRRQHNMRAFEFINTQLAASTLAVNNFDLVQEIINTVQENLEKYTPEFREKTMQIVRCNNSEERPCLRLQLKEQPTDEVDAEFRRDSHLFDPETRFATLSQFSLRNLDFIGTTAINVLSLKGIYTQTDTSYDFKVEVPGVYSKDFILLQRRPELHLIKLIVRRPPLFPENDDDDVAASEYSEYSYIAHFNPAQPFSMKQSPEAVIAAGKLEHGFFYFSLTKVPITKENQ